MNIYDKLEQLSLTESEKILIDYVVEHSEDIMNMSAADISKNSYVSVSTIYRIIEKLELSGLQAFKSHIHFDRERYQKELVSVDYNYPFRINNTNHEIMTKMLKVVETYRADSENEVNDLIEGAKADSSFDLAKYSSEYKEKKAKGDVVDSGFCVTLTKVYSQMWEE